MTLTDWLERLSPGPLPVFAHTRQVLTEQRRRAEEISAREVAQTILSDPFATLDLIHRANQRGSRMGGEITTAESALMMLGLGRYLDQTRNLLVLEEGPQGRDAKLMATLHSLLRRVHHAAWQARDFAVLHSDVRAEEVQVATLLHAIPEFLLLLRAPAEALRLARLKRRLPHEEAEQQVLGGVSLEQLRLPLLESWKIPELSRDLLDPSRVEKPRHAILHACLDIAERAQRGWWDEALLGDYIALAGIENLPLENVIATTHANAMRAERAGDWIAAPGAGAWMPMLPGPWPIDPDDEEELVTAAPAKPVAEPVPPPTAKPAAPTEEEEAHQLCPLPDKQVLRDALQNIEGHLDGSLNLNQMSAVILKGLHTGLGLSRILFAMVTPDGRQIKSRFTLGIKADDPMRHFAFELETRDLFGQLMGKMQGVWMHQDNREKLWPMLHPSLQKMIGDVDFYAMSLHANGKPVGLIYADRGHGDCGLDPHSYTDFKMLCLQAARGLGKLKQ
ncbi:MAG: HDOD domain-containing protein [Gammaproteobacteria bacterium]|nr:HDOD domain-containing protein [Gammaproteobacteria bacterium]